MIYSKRILGGTIGTLEKHSKSCPKLFTTLLENGYGYEAIEYLFLFNECVSEKDIAIELVKNKCKHYNIRGICSQFEQFSDKKKFFNYKDFYIKLCEKIPVSYLLIDSIVHFFVRHEDQINKCMTNEKLFNLLIVNGLDTKTLQEILKRDDYKTLNINNNKELLDLLLKEELIFSDDNKYKHVRELVTKNELVHTLLLTNDLKIIDLTGATSLIPLTSGIKEKVGKLIQAKIKEAQAQSNLPDKHHAKALNLVEQVMEKLKRNQDRVPSLLTLSACA